MAPKQSYIAGGSSSSRGEVNPIVTKYVQRNTKSKVKYTLNHESNENLKFNKVKSKEEKHAFRERLSKLQGRDIAKPRLVNWNLFAEYDCEMELRKMMRMSYVYEGDGDSFEDFLWERAFSIYENVNREWCLEFFSTFYFGRKVVDVVKDKCVWFRLCGREYVYTLPEFVVALGLYDQDEIENRLFPPHFARLVRRHNEYAGLAEYWNRVGDPNCPGRNSSKLRNPLLRILQKLIAWGVLHRTGSRDKCNQPDLWLMKLLEEDKNGNAAWIIAEYLSRRAPGIKDNSVICGGHYVTMLARNLGYFENDELEKCSEIKESETWDDISFGKALNRKTRMLGAWIEPQMAAPQDAPRGAPQQPYQQQPYQPPPHIGNVHALGSFDSGWGDWNCELNEIECREVWRDSMMMRKNYNYDYSMPMIQHVARDADYEVPPYNPPNVPPYPIQYDPYPGQHPYLYPGYTPFPNPVPFYGRVPTIGGSSYNVGGSSSSVGNKRPKFTVFEGEENYEEEEEEENDDESEDERVHGDEHMDADDE